MAHGQNRFQRTGTTQTLFWGFLQVWTFFGHDRAFNRANLQADAAVNASSKVNPVPIGTFHIFARTRVDASNRAGINAVSNAFTGIRNDRVRHRVLPKSFGFSLFGFSF